MGSVNSRSIFRAIIPVLLATVMSACVNPSYQSYTDTIEVNGVSLFYAAEGAGKPVILHSCGNFTKIIDDIIDDMKYDARHSYEDNIIPVEDAYESLNGRITVIGGMDVNFLTKKTPEEVEKRCRLMLERTWERGGYALGSGNSIASYIPDENYLAMIRAAHEFKG